MINITEEKKLQNLLKMFTNLIDGEDNWLANTANAAALIFQELETINWAGFYFIKRNELILGPFQGRPACVRIKIGNGVCGAAVENRKTYVVADVEQFDGHIACDSRSKSEIVIPLFSGDNILGVMDIDSPVKSRFNDRDRQYLEKFADKLITGSVFPESFI